MAGRRARSWGAHWNESRDRRHGESLRRQSHGVRHVDLVCDNLVGRGSSHDFDPRTVRKNIGYAKCFRASVHHGNQGLDRDGASYANSIDVEMNGDELNYVLKSGALKSDAPTIGGEAGPNRAGISKIYRRDRGHLDHRHLDLGDRDLVRNHFEIHRAAGPLGTRDLVAGRRAVGPVPRPRWKSARPSLARRR